MEDEYLMDAPIVRAFIEDVLVRMVAEPRRKRLVEDIRPGFADLLAADGWLPDAFARPSEAGKMGGG
ncbi:MAG: hypothetical protein ACRDGN_13530, partial [bacterium]